MKTTLLPLVAAAALTGGCTTTQTTTASTQEQRRDVEVTTEKRSYSQKELQKRGRQNVGEALEAQDASVRIDGARVSSHPAGRRLLALSGTRDFVRISASAAATKKTRAQAGAIPLRRS